jgi:hypothetical protein
LKAAVNGWVVSPVVPVSATKNIGCDRLLELLTAGPSPLDKGERIAFQALTAQKRPSWRQMPLHDSAVCFQNHLRPVLGQGKSGQTFLGQDCY